MTPEVQRIAIAEACGTLKAGKPKHEHRYGPGPMKVIGHGPPISPDYLSDLNAMHEAERVLTELNRHNYGVSLAKLVLTEERVFFGENPDSEPTLNGLGFFALANLTAAQRAEAFLRTLNLWKD